MTWALSSAQILALTRGSDGSITAFSRTGGSNNPSLQVVNADGSGGSISLNLAAGTTLNASIAGTAVLSIAAALVTAAQPLQLPNGLVGAPALYFAAGATSGFYSIGASEIGLALGGSLTYDFKTTGVTEPAVNVTGSTVPVAGIYQPAANQLGFAANGLNAGTINASGAWSIPTPAAGVALTINGIANSYTDLVIGSSTSGQSYGLKITAGTTSADAALNVFNQAGSTYYLSVQGDGEVYITAPTAAVAGPSGTFQVGYMDAVPNVQNGAYTLAMSDRGKMIIKTGGAGSAWNIPANGTTAFPQGAIITLVGITGALSNTLTISTDSLIWAPSGGTGTRTLTAPWTATLIKTGSTQWQVSGVGLS